MVIALPNASSLQSAVATCQLLSSKPTVDESVQLCISIAKLDLPKQLMSECCPDHDSDQSQSELSLAQPVIALATDKTEAQQYTKLVVAAHEMFQARQPNTDA